MKPRIIYPIILAFIATPYLALADDEPHVWRGVNPEGTHAMILRVETEGAACVHLLYKTNTSGEISYRAGFDVLAIDHHSYSGHALPYGLAQTPLSSDRFMLASAWGFEAEYPDGAHRDHVDVAGHGWSDTTGMDETSPRDPQFRGGGGVGNCWYDPHAPRELQQIPNVWYFYSGDVDPITSYRVRASESGGGFRGDARIVSVNVATSPNFYVSQPYEWDAVVDRQGKDGTLTLLARTSVDVENTFTGTLFTWYERAQWEYFSPEGRIGSNADNCGGAWGPCKLATGRADHSFVHGKEPGTWDWRLEAQRRSTYPQAALMWIDLDEP